METSVLDKGIKVNGSGLKLDGALLEKPKLNPVPTELSLEDMLHTDRLRSFATGEFKDEVTQYSDSLSNKLIISLAERFSDLDLVEEVERFKDERIKKELYLCMSGFYFLRGEHKKANLIVGKNNKVHDYDYALLRQALDKQDNPLSRQFRNLKYDRHNKDMLRELYSERKDDAELGQFVHSSTDMDASQKKEILHLRESHLYDVLCQITGICIAEGDSKNALEYANRLNKYVQKNNGHNHDITGENLAVIEYLRERSDMLKTSHNFGFNSYWRADIFGNERHPGKIYKWCRDFKKEIWVSIGAGAIGAPVLYGIQKVCEPYVDALLHSWNLIK